MVHRVHIPARNFTPFPTQAIEMLWNLRRRHSALVYLVMYHYAAHRKSKRLRASMTQLAKWTGLDYRTVEGCVRELELKRFIKRRYRGTLHSREDLPIWVIPALKFDMSSDGWVPVPSFIVTRYLPAYPGCVLLVFFLYYQNMRKKNYCWPNVSTLSSMTGWFSERRVYDAISIMSDQSKWEKLGTALPHPLDIRWEHDHKTNAAFRCYSVRAVNYVLGKTKSGKRNKPELYLSVGFSRFFDVGARTASAL